MADEAQGMIFTIQGQIRGGKNHINITRTGRRYPNPKWAAWRDHVVALIPRPMTPVATDCRFRARYWNGDLKRRDVPAMLDSIFHCLEKAGVVLDDALIKSVTWDHQGLDRQNPRTEIEIVEVSNG